MKAGRLIIILILGGSLIYLTYKSKYGNSIVDGLISAVLIFLGVILFFWTVTTEIKLYKKQRKIRNFKFTAGCCLFILVIVILQIRILSDFHKPTLLKVFYNGDYNGTGIDFKTDGTYIFDNSAIGFSNYYFGTYRINGNRITLDRDTIDNLTRLRNLELREKEVEIKKEIKNQLYLFQVDVNSNIIEDATEYRVVIDNRGS